MQLKNLDESQDGKKEKNFTFFNNNHHPTVTVDFASSLCVSPLSLYATL